jgi:hypothetical protein
LDLEAGQEKMQLELPIPFLAGENPHSSLKAEVCANSYLMGIRRRKIAVIGVVMNSQGVPEVGITPQLGNRERPFRRAPNQKRG